MGNILYSSSHFLIKMVESILDTNIHIHGQEHLLHDSHSSSCQIASAQCSLCRGGIEKVVQRDSGCVPLLLEQVAVLPESECCVSVPNSVRDRARVEAPLHQERHVQVPQIMKANAWHTSSGLESVPSAIEVS